MPHEATLLELQQDLARAWPAIGRCGSASLRPNRPVSDLMGRTSDRGRVLAQVFEAGVHKIHGLKIDEVRARMFGNAAVVTGRTRGVGEFDALVMTL